MPARQVPLVNGEIYHIISRGHYSMPIFAGTRDYKIFIQTSSYYRYDSIPYRFSRFRLLTNDQKNTITQSLKFKKDLLVKIIAFCLMPNHFHFLIKQKKNNGIKEFISLLNNSYAKYFNIKYKKKGGLFESRFKAIRIETEEQLLHVSRYIHLNPYTSYVVKNFNTLLAYPFSSLPEYLSGRPDLCNLDQLEKLFQTPEKHKEFILDQADYQRTLQKIKHQLIELIEVDN